MESINMNNGKLGNKGGEKGSKANEQESFCYEMVLTYKEYEESKKKYEYLIKKHKCVAEADQAAEAVVKYYLFQLEELKKELPYDAMGCGTTVPLLILHEFQKQTIVEDILDFLGNPEDLLKEELEKEVQKFSMLYLDSSGNLLQQKISMQVKAILAS